MTKPRLSDTAKYQVALNALMKHCDEWPGVEAVGHAIVMLNKQADIAEKLLEAHPHFRKVYTTRLGMSIRCDMIPDLWREAKAVLMAVGNS